MTTITITMVVQRGKSRELLITLHELVEDMKDARGFLDAHIHHESACSKKLAFVEQWETQEDVDAYMMSDYFAILRGAMKALTVSFEMAVSSGLERVQSAAVPESLYQTRQNHHIKGEHV